MVTSLSLSFFSPLPATLPLPEFMISFHPTSGRRILVRTAEHCIVVVMSSLVLSPLFTAVKEKQAVYEISRLSGVERLTVDEKEVTSHANIVQFCPASC